MWDKHRSTEMNICMDCGTKVARKETKRCKPCSTIHRYGRQKKRYQACLDCGEAKTTYEQQLNPRCHPCAQEHRKGSPEEIKLKKNTGRAVRAAIHRSEGSKEGERTFDYLPYTVEELREHLEAQFDGKMSWENYGSYWHIDHIFPQSRLPFDSLDHPNFQKCWALSNLQPLEAKANQSKGAKIL
jgi:hypothetical protein